MNKPISLVIEESKQSIADILNNSNLHPYIMDSIMKELYEEVHSLYIKTIQSEKIEYNKAIQSENETTTEPADE